MYVIGNLLKMAGRGLSICFAVFRSIPVVFITAVIVWSYYAYVVQLCILTMTSTVEQIFCLIFYHPLLILMMWSYWKTIFTPVALPPCQFYLSPTDVERMEAEMTLANRRDVLNQVGRNLPIQCRTPNGEIRFCDKCKAVKPDRAHHCSVCSKCILKMDHHCPWVNNCIGFSNYKFFILFLGYALLYSLYVALTSLQYFISFWSGIGAGNANMNNLHIVFLFFAGIMFAISLMSLFGYHCFLVSKNRSTLESFQAPVFVAGPDKNGFNLGSSANFAEVFGTQKKLWFLPISTGLGDGVLYRTRMASATNSYHTMEAAAISISQSVPSNNNSDGLTYSVNVAVDDDCNNLLDAQQQWTNDGDDTPGGFDNEVLTPHKS